MQNRKRDTDVLLDSVGEGDGGIFQENSIETCILSIVKQITSPGWMHETSDRAWCTGKTQWYWVWNGWWEGGSVWGTHVNPWLIHVNVWPKPLQYCKVISLQLIKINGGKKKASILRCPAFFMVQLSHLYMASEKNIALTIWTLVGNDVLVMSLVF